MKEQLNLTFIDNESHGYIKLSKYDLEAFEIDIKEFSQYSYYNNENACYYFEEDCDATKLINILNKKGYKINLDTNFVDHEYFDQPIFSRIN
tara:strand:- start:756 stop:1031 length:276 start_codon:yes stop_codon:yes gene_type:complete